MKNHRNSLGQLTATENKNADKAARTTQAANDIMHAERKASDAKTARLKAARLARDAAAPVPETASKGARKKKPSPASKAAG